MSDYPFDHIITKLRTTRGSAYALGVMGEAADEIERLSTDLAYAREVNAALSVRANARDVETEQAVSQLQELRDALDEFEKRFGALTFGWCKRIAQAAHKVLEAVVVR